MDEAKALDRSRRALLQVGLAAPLLVAAGSVPAATGAGYAGAREANKAVAHAYVAACDSGDVAKMQAIIAPDATWWIVGRRDFDRPTIISINRGRYKAGEYRVSQILGIAGEEDRVSIEYETATMAGGAKVYRVYHHLFVIRDGMIRSAREYLDPPPLDRPYSTSQAHAPDRPAWQPRQVGPEVEAKTREVALAFLTGARPLAPELRSPDFRWWVTSFGYHDLDAYISALIKIMGNEKHDAPVSPTTRLMTSTVEGERASVHLIKDTIFPNYDYANRFNMVVLVRDGKVVELREHNDLGAAIRGGLPVLEAMKA